MREIAYHQNNVCNKSLKIEVLDEPGSGGANHLYHITGFNSASNPSDPWVARHGEPARHSTILFQHGPIGEVGINGVTHEVLLAILIDRLAAFERGPYECGENREALNACVLALNKLNERTRKHIARGVEGTHEK